MDASGMSLRLELFVEDMNAAITFYTQVLGFELVRRESGYASVRRGSAVLGLGPVYKLPEEAGYFTRGIAARRGLGVENVDSSCHPILEPMQRRPWDLMDFRIADPDGYYLRLTSIN